MSDKEREAAKSTSSANGPAQTRLPYVAPELVEFGSVTELTRNGSRGATNDFDIDRPVRPP
jgi:hypothetical protein